MSKVAIKLEKRVPKLSSNIFSINLDQNFRRLTNKLNWNLPVALLDMQSSATCLVSRLTLLSLHHFPQDRHNGNILIDSEGHLIHIDFGFLLGISPGGNLGFENAAFKLSGEMIEILGGHKDAEPFRCFVDLTLQGFLVAREIALEVLITVTSLMDSGLPCFLYKQNNLDLLRERFFLEDSDSDAVLKMRKLIDDAAKKWTTIAYDGIQKLQNNIYSDSWR